MLFVAATGRLEIMPRYGTMLLPGLSVLTALALAPSKSGWFTRPISQVAVGVLLVLVLLVGVRVGVVERNADIDVFAFKTTLYPRVDFPSLNEYTHQTRIDGRRYREMEELRGEPLAIAVADDTWPAWFVSQHGGNGGGHAPWDILWPVYDYTRGTPLPPDWLERQRNDGRRLAVSHSTASRLGISLDQLFADLSQYRFQESPTGWWIGELVE